MRTPMPDAETCWGGRHFQFVSDDQRQWLERMAARGWTAPTWPREYGGGGLSKAEDKILSEELHAISARPALSSFGLWMIGPALLKFGTEAQKQQHLPPIVAGKIRWCQGYSEPNAGSDLASLQTRAEDRGDHFIVNGQKVWTSYADKADWMFCLVRTDASGSKHTGISLVLFDMQTPGVTPKPIRLISGSSPFCETFLEDVRVEKDQVVGELDGGWTVAKYLLTHERESIGELFTADAEQSLAGDAVYALGAHDGRLNDDMLRAEISQWTTDHEAFRATIQRVQDESKAHGTGHASAMIKYYGTELNKRRQEIALAFLGADALAWHDDSQARKWLRSKGNSIEGGTSEIQLNIIAKRILGLG